MKKYLQVNKSKTRKFLLDYCNNLKFNLKIHKSFKYIIKIIGAIYKIDVIIPTSPIKKDQEVQRGKCYFLKLITDMTL